MHEAVKVAAPSLGEGQVGVEEIHEPGLAAPDAAPQVQSAHRRGRPGRPHGPQPATRKPRRPVTGEQARLQIHEAVDGGDLRRVGYEMPLPRPHGSNAAAGLRPRRGSRPGLSRSRALDLQLRQIAKVLERGGVGERIEVLDRQSMDDVAHRQFGEFPGQRARDVGDGDDRARARAAPWSVCGWFRGWCASAPHRVRRPAAAARTAPRAHRPAIPDRRRALRPPAAGSPPPRRSPRCRCARRPDSAPHPSGRRSRAPSCSVIAA